MHLYVHNTKAGMQGYGHGSDMFLERVIRVFVCRKVGLNANNAGAGEIM